MAKPFSQACENNKQPILAVLSEVFSVSRSVLEIGSGTGQHAVHFARHLPHLTWHTSDVIAHHEGIQAWLDDAALPNVKPPIALQVGKDPFPSIPFDAVFSANTAHIMSAHEVEQMMKSVATNLPSGGVFCQYGPFTQRGQFSSLSNQQFHQHLLRSGLGGYKDISTLQKWAGDSLQLSRIVPMPANNLILQWCKAATG